MIVEIFLYFVRYRVFINQKARKGSSHYLEIFVINLGCLTLFYFSIVDESNNLSVRFVYLSFEVFDENCFKNHLENQKLFAVHNLLAIWRNYQYQRLQDEIYL